MPLQKLVFTPGVNRDQTNYANEGGWYECDKIRFRSGFPQKLGGWAKFITTPLVGICRSMFNWVTFDNQDYLALGTSSKLYIESGTNLYDITPIRATYTHSTAGHVTDNCFDTTNTLTTVNVNIQAHGADAGAYVTFSGVVGPVGGIPASELNDEFEVLTVVDADNFTIQVTTAATSTTTGGGTNITAAFQINPGYTITTYGYGWGAGAWSRGTWSSGAVTPIVQIQRDWFFDNFDSDLVANIRNGAIYYWVASGGISTRAVLLSSLVGASDVPSETTQALISQGNKHLLALGATPFGGGDFDPLLIRWSNQDQPTNWTPSSTTSAGFLRVPRGSRIICGLASRQETLVWTEATLNSLQFLGTTEVFGLQELADNISIISPRSTTTVNNVTYWMGLDKFYAYSGRVETLPCTLRNHVFQNLNYDQADQIVSGTNEGWHEVWWFYPTADSLTNNAYVVYNYLEKVWHYGYIECTAWLDSPLRSYPLGVGNNYVYNHEYGTDADGLPMASYIQSSDFDLVDGDQFILVRRIIPDMSFSGSTANNPVAYVTVKPRNFPGANYTTEVNKDIIETSSVPVEQYTNQVFIRARARQMGFKVGSVDLGVQWQLGSPRLDGRPDGKR
mgnify:FL=1